jgi:hypothetical protein
MKNDLFVMLLGGALAALSLFVVLLFLLSLDVFI